KQWIKVYDSWASITTSGLRPLVLRFAEDKGHERSVPRFWTLASRLRPGPAGPLDGVNIALDPGHLGGQWARMEERWFQLGDDTKPVTEGDMTLRVAKLLASRLRVLGADVSLIRRDNEPLTKLRPEDLREAAKAELEREG